MLPEPTLRHIADFDIDLDPISEMGDGHAGMHRIIPIVGGRITGPEFTGEILNVGADWQTIFNRNYKFRLLTRTTGYDAAGCGL